MNEIKKVARDSRINPKHAQTMADGSITALRNLPIKEKDSCKSDPDQAQECPTNIDNH